jgi:Integrase core domain.
MLVDSWEGTRVVVRPALTPTCWTSCEWSLDLIVSLGDKDSKIHVLSAICCFSKFCVLTLIDDKSSRTVANALREKVFQVFGNPAKVRTDNGTEFKGEFEALCLALKIKHVQALPTLHIVMGKFNDFTAPYRT